MKTKLTPQSFARNLKQQIHKKNLHNLNQVLHKEKSFDNFSIEEKERIVIEGQSGKSTIRNLCIREGITQTEFYQWSQEFLDNKEIISRSEKSNKESLSDDDKFRIVLEGNNGEYSIAEICRRENIIHEQFLQWSEEFLQIRAKRIRREFNKDKHTSESRDLILEFTGKDTLNYFESFIDVTSKETHVINDLKSCTNSEPLKGVENLVCLSKINDIRHINKHFELVNNKLPIGGVFVGCLESFSARRLRMNINKLPVINEIYFGGEFLFKRIIPKLNLTKRHYFNITKGKDRLLSKAEGLGRLVSCGFKIMDYKSINGLVYFVVKKVGEPVNVINPSYGPIYRMPRIGKNGKIIKVYKFRTMHPYSEFLQDYVLRANGYAKTGKPAEDFRIPAWGKVIRKFWLDELPQLINVLKGEMKLVGIRPVSERYFQDIPKEMQKLRLTQKPGCIPPYVALNREGNVMSVLQAEKDYLEEKIRNPYTTDLKYFVKAIYNIAFRHKRSA